MWNLPDLAEDEVRALDLRRDAGRITGTVNVTGGMLERLTMRTDATDSSIPESFQGYVQAAPPIQVVLPTAPIAQTRVYGNGERVG